MLSIFSILNMQKIKKKKKRGMADYKIANGKRYMNINGKFKELKYRKENKNGHPYLKRYMVS